MRAARNDEVHGQGGQVGAVLLGVATPPVFCYPSLGSVKATVLADLLDGPRYFAAVRRTRGGA